MAEFETLKAERFEFNNGDEFIELSLSVARDAKRVTKYWRIARGSFTEDGTPRYRRGGLTLPNDREAVNKLADALKNVDLSELESDAT